MLGEDDAPRANFGGLMRKRIVRGVSFAAFVVLVSCVSGLALADRHSARPAASGESAFPVIRSEASMEASPGACSAGLDVLASSFDDADACAAICSAHFSPGSAEHRECVACCYDPDCQ